MSAFVTVQQAALHLLPYIGVTQFNPQPIGAELEDLGPQDINYVLRALNGAMQVIFAEGPLEARQLPGSGFLHGPASLTLTATNGSNAVSAVTTWAAWMQGCTVRITGDDQDNEFLSSTKLARPFAGSSASGISATVYGDCITLDDSIGKIAAPIYLPNQLPLQPCFTRDEFLRKGGYTQLTNTSSGSLGAFPFFLFYRKPISRPFTWFVDSAFDPTLGYLPRRLRFSPMPDKDYSIAYTAGANPTRWTKADIIPGLTTLTATGATSDANVNENYTYAADVAGYQMFKGVSHSAYSIFFNPDDNAFFINSTLAVTTLAAVACWKSDAISSPLGTFTPQNGATGTVTVTTSDVGGGTADPGTLIPVPDGWVESIFLPIALQRFSRSPLFRNASALPGIQQDYQNALLTLRDSRAQVAVQRGNYIGP